MGSTSQLNPNSMEVVSLDQELFPTKAYMIYSVRIEEKLRMRRERREDRGGREREREVRKESSKIED